MMNIYVVEIDKCEYGEYDSHVVIADTAIKAKEIAIRKGLGHHERNETEQEYRDRITTQMINISKEHIALSSWNDG